LYAICFALLGHSGSSIEDRQRVLNRSISA